MAQTNETIISLENKLIEAQQKHDKTVIIDLLTEDFREIGSSGRILFKADILNFKSNIRILKWSIQDFFEMNICEEVVVATYLSTIEWQANGHQNREQALRSSIWRYDDRWQMIFHQGTPVHDK